jgi:Flp pilus assembly protein TadB
MAVSAAVVGAVAAVGGTAASVEGSAQQRRLAGQAANRAQVATNDQIAAAQKQKDDSEKQSAEAALRDSNRQRTAAAQTLGGTMNGTLLTGPSGIGKAPSGGGKTLLGS